MQLNTLNRVIALFLIGGFVVVLAAVSFEAEIRTLIEPYSKMELGAPAGVFLAVALLSITALAGTLVDALGNLTVRRVIRKWLAKDRSHARMFFCAEEFDEQDRWRRTFRASLVEERYKALAEDDMIKAASAALFFRTAEREHTEWLVQHHSMYHLSANFAVILIGSAAWSLGEGAYYLAAGSILGAYLVTTFALDNYLYTYQLSFRNAYLAVSNPPAADSATSGKDTKQSMVSVTPPPHDGQLGIAAS